MRFLSAAAATILAAALAAALTGCSGFGFFAANAPNPLGSFKRTANLVYGNDARQRLDVYAPKKAGNRPIVIFFYGGTWVMGQKAE